MKKYIALSLVWGSVSLFAEPACPLCELHRAYNKEHPGDYEYYDDYLKAADKKEKSTSEVKPEAKAP